jgi:hypothetical protein
MVLVNVVPQNTSRLRGSHQTEIILSHLYQGNRRTGLMQRLLEELKFKQTLSIKCSEYDQGDGQKFSNLRYIHFRKQVNRSNMCFL